MAPDTNDPDDEPDPEERIEQTLDILQNADEDTDIEALLDDAGFERVEVPETHEKRAANPPMVPLHGDRDLVWMEWNVVHDGDIAHTYYHRADPGTNDTRTVGPAILTRAQRAGDLGSIPCPQCFPDEDENDHLATVFDEETGIATTINPDELNKLRAEQEKDQEEDENG